ncbi:ATPase, T2SS/T4P/T4SS family [Bacillus salitolerans]|uniref:ATPase, T2SS/T4P/T4SS family n=1 Tax=Bacillus salitolerans TaxID=1437434 RepID=A0ABW4LNF2_9BACI
MSFTLNLTIIFILLLFFLLFMSLRLVGTKDRDRKKKKNKIDESQYTIPALIDFVKTSLNQITNSNLYDLGLSEDEFNRRQKKRKELLAALQECNTGSVSAKLYVTEFIFDLLARSFSFNEQTANLSIPFHQPSKLTHQDKFDILLHLYKKQYGYEALLKLILKYNLNLPKVIDDEEGVYIITPKEIEDIYDREIAPTTLSTEDKLKIITQRVYSQYLGFGPIDEIRDMDIDGISGGVNGLPSTYNSYDDEMDLVHCLKKNPSNVDSVWIMLRGKTIYLSFLSFGTEAELRRVVQTVYKHNRPGQLSEARPYIVNTMADGSRVVVLRPPFAESWAFFIRKFDLPKASLPQLIEHRNSNLPISLLKFLMAGSRTTAVTGQTGAGKTTLLMALIKYIHHDYELRIQEMAFELNLRNLYPRRNIVSFQETHSVSGQEGLDVSKKTDGTVNILGEVATDPVAAWMIQVSQVASAFTLFTHHGKTFNKLISSLRNSLIKTSMFSNEILAEEEVVNAIHFNIHLRKDHRGERYIERVTECIPLEKEVTDYPTNWVGKDSLSDKIDAFMETATEYFRRKTDKRTYVSRNIIEFRNGEYVAVHPISEEQIKEMYHSFTDRHRKEFDEFMKRYWGE